MSLAGDGIQLFQHFSGGPLPRELKPLHRHCDQVVVEQRFISFDEIALIGGFE